ncbi:sensor histidine kinase [Leptolyngbya ohadii]|uniref:sensor histidine kinase n=1 Tax=Leptolyngbya ohadii TaxID=1962290 RepID=UPI000B599CFA|nr:PAS domain-containing sensor histidine kinase [Leptolyngbya ohadii]
MPPFLQSLLSSGPFIPHGHCYLWQTPLVGLHLLSDVFIALAYYSIPIFLVAFSVKRKDLPFRWLFWLFGAFIVSCGTTHWLDVVTLWYPVYWFSGGVKAVTALVSVATVMELVPLYPKALALPSPEQLRVINQQLEQEIEERKAVEEALRESEQRNAELSAAALREKDNLLQLFAQYAPAGIAMFDQQMRYLIASQRWVDDYTLGSIEALMERSHYEIVPHIPERWKQIHQRCLAGATERCEEDRFVRADGVEKFIRWEVRPWYQAAGDVGGIIMFSEDITEQKQAERALQQLNTELEQRVVERTAELTALSDRLREAQEIARIGSWEYNLLTGEINWSNEIFQIFALSPEQPVPSYEQHLRENYLPEEAARLQAAVTRALEQGEPYELDLQIIRSDGSTGWILGKGKPIVNEHQQVVRLVGTALDITERKTLEVEQQQLVHLKDDFLSTVSHELRSPLASIKMAIHLLEIKLGQVLPVLETENTTQCQQIRQYLSILHQQCDQELEIVNNLLDLQRLEAGGATKTIAPIQVLEWVEQVASAYQERAQERQQQLQVLLPPSLPELYSDSEILTSVLRELLTNACKYTPPGETITVQVEPTTADIRIIVQNSGSYIPKAELERIFDKFYRVPGGDPWKQGGTGLGLALAKKQVEYLGGSMRAESDARGVRFIVSLPIEIC